MLQKKSCIYVVSPGHLLETRNHFNSLTYDQQNLYLTGLIIRKETKKSSGHRRKKNPIVSKNGEKVGRPPAETSKFSIDYNIRNEKGINVKVCQKSFILVHGFGKRRLEVLRKKFSVVAHNPEYIQHMKDKQKAIINHTAGNEEESEVDDMKPLVSKHYYNDVFVTEFNL